MMKKFVCGIAALSLVFASLGGCNGKSASAQGSAGGVEGRKLRIGVSIPAADHGWTAGVNYWAKQAAELYPDVEWTIQAAADPTKQIQDIETMMAKDLDGMVILATESAPITPIAKKVKEAGIFLVSVDRGFLEPVADIFVEGDNKAFGRKSAEYIVKKLGGQGNVVILEGIPSTVNTDRVEAAREVFAASPGIRILDSQSGMWNREKAYSVMQGILVKHPKIDAVWASDDDMALGAEKAIKEAGRENEMWMLGGAGMKDIVKRVMENDRMFPANITYPPSMIAMGMHLAAATLRDGNHKDKMKFVPRHILLDVELITPENAKDFYFPDSVY